ncbi:MAG: hypothetical protein KJ645_09770 [Planctomycetes bacterium]|nr:hypothetical protein [Planctomycetota bacterium]
MGPTNLILLIFEQDDYREESLRYSIMLAGRMASTLLVLVLRDHQDKGDDRINRLVSKIPHDGVTIRTEIRCGDKASELLKYVATIPPPTTVVWGSDESVLTSGSEKRTKHWFARFKSEFQCPIVTSKARDLKSDV